MNRQTLILAGAGAASLVIVMGAFVSRPGTTTSIKDSSLSTNAKATQTPGSPTMQSGAETPFPAASVDQAAAAAPHAVISGSSIIPISGNQLMTPLRRMPLPPGSDRKIPATLNGSESNAVSGGFAGSSSAPAVAGQVTPRTRTASIGDVSRPSSESPATTGPIAANGSTAATATLPASDFGWPSPALETDSNPRTLVANGVEIELGPGIPVPVALLEPDRPMTPQIEQAFQAIREDFSREAAQLGGASAQPSDSQVAATPAAESAGTSAAYFKAVQRADDRYRALFGDAAFNAAQMRATRGSTK